MLNQQLLLFKYIKLPFMATLENEIVRGMGHDNINGITKNQKRRQLKVFNVQKSPM